MALPSSGPLSINDIAVEFGGSVPHSLSEYYGVATGIPASGTIAIDDFYGTSSASPISATGGTISDSGGYRYHTFTSNGTFTINSPAAGAFSNTVETLIVAAGGGIDLYSPSLSTSRQHGGGGAGGMVETSFSASVGSKSVSIGQPVNFGTGLNSSVTSLTTAIGGGRGGRQNQAGLSGGSGGGSGNGNSGASGTAGQGNSGGGSSVGGYGGGGGGAGQAGQAAVFGYPSNGGRGGNGKTWLNGVTYAGGGGGGGFSQSYNSGAGGTGGGGYLGNGTFYGGGAGAGANSPIPVLQGYQGIVIFRYQI